MVGAGGGVWRATACGFELKSVSSMARVLIRLSAIRTTPKYGRIMGGGLRRSGTRSVVLRHPWRRYSRTWEAWNAMVPAIRR